MCEEWFIRWFAYRARGFTAAITTARWNLSRINHCEGAITAAITAIYKWK